ncbi:MAG: hypothetical protein Pg6B_11240 [Candidatus Azobacteroides pseudotrichonymphae]|uniref:hypothetical protein n=1 Tax=Candidatus Azobacteroides pseudotrichonymphae TaxID=511435 RepID=UPI0005A115AD|nr:hypothetical protein [Candidatus Azobacteroides pseudotrichonymphae]GMO39248.1 MAG: hypothetical protein Pg6B_11240 [Candidatus Azobacteroides pseudotrichonymphae]
MRTITMTELNYQELFSSFLEAVHEKMKETGEDRHGLWDLHRNLGHYREDLQEKMDKIYTKISRK